MLVFTGKEGVNTFRAVALKIGLSMYAKTGMQPNRMWSPRNMLRAASGITGKAYKRGAYAAAIADLETWIAANGTAGNN